MHYFKMLLRSLISHITTLLYCQKPATPAKEISTIHKLTRWGTKRGSSETVYPPSVKINYYSNSTNEHIINILDSNNNEIKKVSHKSDKGFHTVSHDLSYSKKAMKSDLKNNKETILDEAKNGIYYLFKGKQKGIVHYQTVSIDVE
jgi:hypothetical protein